MKVVLASDHAGFEYKKELLKYLEENGVETVDVGAHSFDENDDYPEFIANASKEVSAHPNNTFGIILGGSGQGEAIVANRFREVRAAVYNTNNIELIKLAREHNDANVLSIGARFITVDQAKEAVKIFLDTPFSEDERHVRRIEQINKYA
jgi:ribose 5-phosphate isomerase B